MSLIGPIVPFLGPLGQILSTNSNDILTVGLGLLAVVCLGLYSVKKSIFETSKAWVGATVVLSFVTLLFRGMGAYCGCTWYTDPNTGDIQQLVPITYLLIAGSFFGILGRRIGKLLGVFGGLKTVLSLAGMKIGFKAYVSSMVFAAMLGGGISFFVWFLILNLGLASSLGLSFTITSILLEVILSIGLAVMTGVVILGVFYMLPYMKVGSRRNRLDQFLPFTSSYMTVLASAGVTPERILRSTAEKDPKFMLSDEIANVIGRIDLLGYDVINAMNAEVERSPSTNYQDLLRGFAGVIRTGGDMKKFFQGITDHLFQKRALSVQGFLDTLGIIAETYVLMLIAFPLMLVVMLSIMASIGGNLGGVDVFSFMYLLAFILIPICGVMFLFILDTMQPKG